MGQVSIDINMDRVQSSVNAAIRPAVDSVLSKVDFKAMIEKALLRKPRASADDYMVRMLGYEKRPLLEEMIEASIQEIAQQHVRLVLNEMKPDIEAGLRKAMEGSGNRLAKAFIKTAERALADEWGFDLDFSVKAKEKTRDDD